MELQVGQRVNDYEILSVLGAGGMGRVYCVRNIISGRTDAMKVLLPDLSAERDLADRFTSEIRTLASFDHPNIAQLRTAFQFENQLVMVMEYVEGVTLEQQARKVAMPPEDAVGYISQTLSALSYAHGRGVIHRDIKPANMMVTSHGIVKLMDFGIAKSSQEPQLTRTGMTIGSMYYMSPEQVRGDTVDARSDIYSVGITLYELLAGRKPFEAVSTFSILNQQLNEAPRPLTEINPAIPAGLSSIVLLALAKDPQQRFQTADAFRNALRTFERIDEPGTTWAPITAALPWAPPDPAPVAQPQPLLAAQAAAPDSAPPLIGLTSPPPPKSRRGLWIGLGAAAALLAIVLAATVLPRMLTTHAANATPKAASTDSTGTSPNSALTATPAASPSNDASAAPWNASGGAAGTMEPPATASSPASQPPSAQPVPGQAQAQGSVKPRPAVTAAVKNGGPVGGGPVVPRNSPGETGAQPAGNSQQALEEASDRLLQFQARSSAANESINRIRQQQEQEGLGLRGDVAAALGRMNAYEAGASRAIAEKNPEAADKSLDRAQRELDTLEKFLGK